MRVAPANAADCLASDPKSAIAAVTRRMIGATTANSAATLPRQPAERRAPSRGRCLTSLLRLMTTSFEEGGVVNGRFATEPSAGAIRGREAGGSVDHDPARDQQCAGCTRIALEAHL